MNDLVIRVKIKGSNSIITIEEGMLWDELAEKLGIPVDDDTEENVLDDITIEEVYIAYDDNKVDNRWKRCNLNAVLEYSEQLYALWRSGSIEHMLAYLENEGGDLEDAMTEFENRSVFWGKCNIEDVGREYFATYEGYEALEKYGRFINWEDYLDDLLEYGLGNTSYGFIEIRN